MIMERNSIYFLFSARTEDNCKYQVKIVSKLSSVFTTWAPVTRISPLYKIKTDSNFSINSPSDEEFSGHHYLLLFGPFPPEDILQFLKKEDKVWLGIGLHNVITDLASQKHAKDVENYLQSKKVPHELWELRNGTIIDFKRFSPYVHEKRWRSSLSKLGECSSLAPDISKAVEEYCPLMASTLAKAETVYPQLFADLMRIHEETINVIRDGNSDQIETNESRTLGQLIYLNAGLSRFASQTFGGTLPVLESDCYFRSHALLGIGIASLGLLNFCRFIENVLGEARIPDRFASFASSKNYSVINLAKLSSKDDFWKKDHIGEAEIPKTKHEPIVPLLLHFSGRDGFRSYLTTISSPLACVSSANTYRWSPLTLTHEISHVIIRGILGELYPDLESNEDVEFAMALLKEDKPASNLLDEIRRIMLMAIIKMDDVATNRRTSLNFHQYDFVRFLERWHHDIEEIMAHVFDFMYFYGQKPDRYIKGIWMSWGTIPNINSRIPDYVTRSICAIMPPLISKGVSGVEIARDQTKNYLGKLAKDLGDNSYIKKALDCLKEHWDGEIKQRVFARLGLIKIVKTFLFSEKIATRLRRETEIAGDASKREGYTLKPCTFSGKKIRNPIRFVEMYANSNEPSDGIAAWMFYVLAFMDDGHENE